MSNYIKNIVRSLKHIGPAFIFTLLFFAIGCEKNTGNTPMPIDGKSYLKEWLGEYAGTSLNWDSSYNFSTGETTINEKYRSVFVNVENDVWDSTLFFTITFDDTIQRTYDSLVFSPEGKHYSLEWYFPNRPIERKVLDIHFKNDSLYFDAFYVVAPFYHSGFTFNIAKQ